MFSVAIFPPNSCVCSVLSTTDTQLHVFWVRSDGGVSCEFYLFCFVTLSLMVCVCLIAVPFSSVTCICVSVLSVAITGVLLNSNSVILRLAYRLRLQNEINLL